MIEYLLLGGSVSVTVARNIFSKTKKEYFSGLKNLMTVNLFTALIALIIFALTGLSFSKIDGASFWLISLAYGVFVVLSQTLNILAVKHGDVSVCSMIYASGFILPTLFSAFFLNEGAGLTKLLGIGLMLIAIVLINVRISKEEKGKKSYRYLFYSVPAMLCSGALGVLQKIFFKTYTDGQNEFLFLAFIFVAVISAVCILLGKFQRKAVTRGCGEEEIEKAEGSGIRVNRNYVIAVASYTVCAALAYKLNMYLSGALSGVIFFPVYNGGSLIITAIISMLFLKEKCTLFKVLGILVGVSAIVLIAI